jgi:hypothetical protein
MWPLQGSLRKGFIPYFPVNIFKARKENTRLIVRIKAVHYSFAGQHEGPLVFK